MTVVDSELLNGAECRKHDFRDAEGVKGVECGGDPSSLGKGRGRNIPLVVHSGFFPV